MARSLRDEFMARSLGGAFISQSVNRDEFISWSYDLVGG